MRIGFGVGPQQKLTVEDIQRAVIALPVVDVFDGHLNAQVLSAPYVATRIAPQEVTLIYEEGTELAFLYRGPVVNQFFFISSRVRATCSGSTLGLWACVFFQL